jgi:DNA-binding response OmpR family regulator
MALSKEQTVHRVLLVGDDNVLLGMMRGLLEPNGFEVVAANGVTEALKCIATESFEVLITDPDAGDYLTVISAMRRSQPAALTMLLSTFPDGESAMEAIVLEAIILEADEIVVKPVELGRLGDLVRNRLLIRRPATRPNKESVSTLLRRCSDEVVKNWLVRARQARELNHLTLKDEERAGHLPKLVEDLVVRLSEPIAPQDSDANCSAAVLHGELRYAQGYTPEMLVHESRILQVTLFETLKDNMSDPDFSLLLPDAMKIADEVGVQLSQTMGGYMNLTMAPKPTQLAAA